MSDVRARLVRWGAIDRSLEDAHKCIKYWRGMLDDLYVPSCTQRITGMPRGGGSGDSTAQTALECSPLADEYLKNIKQVERRAALLAREKRKIEAAMDRLTQDQRDVLQMKFRDGLTPLDIASKKGGSARRVNRIITAAIGAMSQSVRDF